MSSIFSVIGDSNIRNHVNKNSCRANPALKAAQTLSCGNMSILPATLEKVRPESNACILACLTNFLTDADGPPTVSLRVGPVLQVTPLHHYLISFIQDVLLSLVHDHFGFEFAVSFQIGSLFFKTDFCQSIHCFMGIPCLKQPYSLWFMIALTLSSLVSFQFG